MKGEGIILIYKIQMQRIIQYPKSYKVSFHRYLISFWPWILWLMYDRLLLDYSQENKKILLYKLHQLQKRKSTIYNFILRFVQNWFYFNKIFNVQIKFVKIFYLSRVWTFIKLWILVKLLKRNRNEKIHEVFSGQGISAINVEYILYKI